MLCEIRVENLLLMERAELRLGPGLNVLTGETGAGKTLLAQALDLLLGGKARAGIVREGASEAYVEGVFELPDWLRAGRDALLPADAQELVLARRVWPDGRTRAYVCGRSATVGDLRELGSRMLSFYGQHEHRRLMLASVQLDALDSFCGVAQAQRRARMRKLHGRVRELETQLGELEGQLGARERELDLVGFELREIEQVNPSVEEEQELLSERDRLRHEQTLRRATAVGMEALSGDEGLGAVGLLSRAAVQAQAAAALDRSLEPLAQRLAALRYEAEDAALELRAYLEGLESQPGRLELVEERLGAFARLARKHGGDVAEVLAQAELGRSRLQQLEGAESASAALEAELEQARLAREQVGDELSAARAQAAPRLAAAVLERLAELAMAQARFEVALAPREDGYGARGRDSVEFLIAPNPGLPCGSLREIASGGELSRVMLALLSAAHAAAGDGEGGVHRDGGGSMLVFDEVDAGIGGHTARAVGQHLRELARGHQILCITHLPQVAALADRHFTIIKDGSRSLARTTVAQLEGEAVVGELVRMLGADGDDQAAHGHARELLRAA